MEKIPTALVRDPNNRSKVLPEITPGCEWVFAGEGVPTRKWDGTCVMLDADGKWWARREVKVGQRIPLNFVAITEQDQVTGKIQGWIPIEDSPFAKFHAEALREENLIRWLPGTYELVGPKINGNPDHAEFHCLMKHSDAPVVEYTSHGFIRGHNDASYIEMIMKIVKTLGERGWEGVVWHHPDGRMAKLKARDL